MKISNRQFTRAKNRAKEEDVGEEKTRTEVAMCVCNALRTRDERIAVLEEKIAELEREALDLDRTTCAVYDQIVAATGIQDGWDYPGQVVRCVEDAIKAARDEGRQDRAVADAFESGRLEGRQEARDEEEERREAWE